MSLDADACYRALAARDARFDGVFFVGVTTTGIYCRPVCRARTPGRARCRFFRLGAEAEHAGYRACFRCRPELAPGSASVDARSRLVARAVARIDAGALNEASLAAELGVTARHLRRALGDELGLSPVALAQSRRLALAKALLCDSALDVAGVAFASGFGSVRRLNALFRARFGRSPSSVRRERAGRAGRAHDTGPGATPRAGLDAVTVKLGYRPPFAWGELLAFLRPRALAGVELVTAERYLRTVALAGHRGALEVRDVPAAHAVEVTVGAELAPVLRAVVARVRRMFDLDADPSAVDAHLARDPLLRAGVRRVPGLRVPGAFDPFEMALRAVLGQQVSVAGATTLAGRLVARFGAPLDTGRSELARTFPSAATLAAVPVEELAALGLPASRARTLAAVARACAAGQLPLEDPSAHEAWTRALAAIPGIGPWTTAYLALRLGVPDAFPETDLGLRRALGPDAAGVRTASARWRPWRAYAALHLWRDQGPTSLRPRQRRRTDKEETP
ncbi:MAG: helix-turn-helix domain-containing protein [Polyangiaceae bacterium]|nr:helix-turn-helix domain-containing protein [Polyangiaceae bacterium]